MEIELRPLSLSEMLDRIFQLYRARLVLFLGIAGVSSLIELVWSVINLGESRWMTRRHFSVTSQQFVTSLSTIPTWMFLFAAAALCLAASNRAVAAIYDGRPTGIVKAYAQLRSGWVKYIWVNTLGFFIAWGSIIVVLLAGVTATLVATRTKTLGQPSLITLVYGAMGLLILVALPLCLWLTLRYSLAVPACVEEGLGTLRSLKRSVFLTQDTKGRILVLLLIVMGAQSMLASAFLAPVFVFILRARGQSSPAMIAYTAAMTTLCSVLIKPIYSIGLTLFYYDARVRKEGFDLERMLERLSIEPAASTGTAV